MLSGRSAGRRRVQEKDGEEEQHKGAVRMRSTEGQNNGAVQKGIAEEQQEEAVQELHSQQEQKNTTRLRRR